MDGHGKHAGIPTRRASEKRSGAPSDPGRGVGRAGAAQPVEDRGPLVARERYRHNAATYDEDTAAGDAYRGLAVAALDPKRGEAIADVGCGTGRNFSLIEEGIRAEGRLIGVDVCPEMLEVAQAGVRRSGWRNVELIASPAEAVDLHTEVDAMIVCGAHDVMRSPRGVENIVRQVHPGGRVVAAGPKWAPPWLPWAPWVNLWTWQLNRRFVTVWDGFDRPWSHLARFTPDLHVRPVFFGGGYVASGTVAKRRAADEPTVE
jgi:ubiquinone/menaquinone biosynthesis C-methylase UbiE